MIKGIQYFLTGIGVIGLVAWAIWVFVNIGFWSSGLYVPLWLSILGFVPVYAFVVLIITLIGMAIVEGD